MRLRKECLAGKDVNNDRCHFSRRSDVERQPSTDDKKAADVEDHFGFLCDVGHSPRLGGSRLGISIRTESPVPGASIAFLKHKTMLIWRPTAASTSLVPLPNLVEQVLNAAPGGTFSRPAHRFPKFAANSTASCSPSTSLRVLSTTSTCEESLIAWMIVSGSSCVVAGQRYRGIRPSAPHCRLELRAASAGATCDPASPESVFAGWFTSELASAVAGGEAFAVSHDYFDCIAMI